MEQIFFLILSLLTGVLEIGVVWAAAQTGSGLTVALIYVLGYQLGNLAFVKTRGYIERAYIAGMLGVVSLGVLNLFPISSACRIVLYTLCVFSASLLLQTARSKVKGRCSTGIKRLFRIMGFILAPLMSLYSNTFFIFVTVLSIVALVVQKNDKEKISGDWEKVLVFSMIFHQMHYFVYTYVFLWKINEWITGKIFHNSFVMTSVAFALTWFVYLLPEVLSIRNTKNNCIVHFFVGHSFLLIIMISLSLVSIDNIYLPMLILWGLTGLGGGTVYAIPRLAERYKQIDMKLSEDIGHVLGVVTAIVVSILIDNLRIKVIICITLSAIFVAVTIILVLIEIKKERK